MRITSTLLTLLLISTLMASAQEDDLMALLDDMEEPKREFVTSTFKTTRIINGHSIETNGEGQLNVFISHRFGKLNGLFYEWFGLDEANIRLGFEYGVTDRLDVGFGRSSFEKTYDMFAKYKVMQQSKGKKAMPLTIDLFARMAIKTLRWPDNNRTNYFSSRMSYTYQVMIARKIGERLSLQLTPTMVHHNLVETRADRNDIFGIGAGGRFKISKSMAIQAEYFYVPNGQVVSNVSGSPRRDAVSIGIDIETGGHVFQLHFTNTRSMIEKGFITETNGDITKGDIHFGFNVSRVFAIYDANKVKKKRLEKKMKRLEAKG